MTGSTLRLLVPPALRKFLRDFDSDYQEKLKEIDIKNRQIADLQSILREFQEFSRQEIKAKNLQITDLGNINQALLQKLNSQEFDIQEQKKTLTITNEDYHHLSQVGIFIVGCARSGTSILCDCLNLSSETLLLGEANFYLHHGMNNFVDFFNHQHMEFQNRRCKGTFIPPSRLPEESGFEFLLRMSKNYKFVGEKIAFGPNGKYGNEHFQEVFLHFHSMYFYFSKYILIMRRPTEVIWSMVKMFPQKSIDSIFDCWLRTIKIQIDVFHAFPNTYILFLENLNLDSIMNLGVILGIDIQVSQGMIREDHKYSLLAEGEIPEQLTKYSEICLNCEEIYQQIKNEVSLDTYRLNNTAANYGNAQFGFSDSIQKQIDGIINILSSIKG